MHPPVINMTQHIHVGQVIGKIFKNSLGEVSGYPPFYAMQFVE
jgi:hypothetical protein